MKNSTSTQNPLNYNRYSYCLFSPLQYVDPSGELYNPIFDWQGNFLGTDDRGIQGEAIIMNKSDFRQNMAHDDAIRKGYWRRELPYEQYQALLDKIDNQTSTFPNRPDWDGYLTDKEARMWYKNGNGEPLFVNQALFDLTPITIQNFKNKSQITNNFFFNISSNKDIGRVYGTLTLNLVNSNTGEIKIGNPSNAYIDTYDFNMGGNFFRNIATWGAKKLIGNGYPFDIYGWGNNPKIPIK